MYHRKNPGSHKSSGKGESEQDFLVKEMHMCYVAAVEEHVKYAMYTDTHIHVFYEYKYMF